MSDAPEADTIYKSLRKALNVNIWDTDTRETLDICG